MIDHAVDAFISRADLADLALFLWASGASAAAGLLLRELSASNKRFDEFVRELHLFNARNERSSPGLRD